jgi:LmbE family N-acetylglucosaminyl deacetylase
MMTARLTPLFSVVSFRRVVALAMVGLTLPVGAQDAAHDPANLTGERVRPQVLAEALPQDEGAVGLAQTLKKLGTRASLMLLVAHPDDEDGGMLTYESRGQGARVAMMTLNRGEGGQNLMSADFEDALGLVRTQELLAADRYMGVDQMFGTVVDYGFSKTKEEAFAKWGRERVLYDAVRAVRLNRPLVVAAVFVGGVTDGHGHHQVSGELAQEMLAMAGDPKVFPEMGLAPWTPLKVYARLPFAKVTKDGMYDYATNKYLPTRFYNYVTKTWSTEIPKANVTVPEGEFSQALGMSYVQFARKGLALQKTQIGGNVRLAPGGKYDVGYTRYGSKTSGPEQEAGFFDGVDVTLTGIATLAPEAGPFLKDDLGQIQRLVTRATAEFSGQTPEKTAQVLAEGLKAVDALIVKVETSGIAASEKTNVLHELRVKRVQFNTALTQALGLKLTATGSEAVVPGGSLHVGLRLEQKSAAPVTVEQSVVTTSFGTRVAARLTPGGSQTLDVPIPTTAPATRPFFHRANLEQAYYDLSNPLLREAAVTPYPFVATVRLRYAGATVELASVVGDGSPAMVVPALSVAVAPEVALVPLGQKTLTVTATVRNDQTGPAHGELKLELPEGWRSEPERASFDLTSQNAEARKSFTVTPAALAAGKEYTLQAVAEAGGKAYREGFRAVGYPGLTPTNQYRAATARVVGGDVKVAPGLKVAYLPGTGDAVVASLEQIGVKATTISVADVTAGRLTGYDAVVLGVRAFAAHPELEAANAKLLAYAAAGGTVIVQYNTGEMPAGPYPMSLGDSEKVVEETAAVTLLHPQTQALTWPNRITPKDFDGWVEERGHGFMGTWDPRYVALTEVHDPEQDPQRGGLLIAKTGKGSYVYVAYALYRQLPEGVPGAYRLFANLLSLGKTPATK